MCRWLRGREAGGGGWLWNMNRIDYHDVSRASGFGPHPCHENRRSLHHAVSVQNVLCMEEIVEEKEKEEEEAEVPSEKASSEEAACARVAPTKHRQDPP